MNRLMHLGLSWLLLFCWPESVPALQEKEPIAVRSGTVTFQFYPLPDEKIDEVRLAGSMSAWDPFAPAFVMKRQSDGSFRLDLPLTAGTHRFKFVVDGRWTADMRDISGRYRPSFAVTDGGNLGEAVLLVADDGRIDSMGALPQVLAAVSFDRDVSGLTAAGGVGTAWVKWELADTAGVKEIQILKRANSTTQYRPKATLITCLAPDAGSAELKLEPLSDITLIVRLVSTDGRQSRGETARVRVQHRNVVADELDGRPLYVYLPPGYADEQRSYPVAYMHDGQNLFAPGVGSADEWRVDEVLDSLIAKERVEKLLAVGIGNSARRREEYIPYSPMEGVAYAQWVVQRVVPYIESRYRVSRTREDRAVMGSSLGGVLSLWMVRHHADVFSMGGVISAATVPGVVPDVEATPGKGVRIWMDVGEDETGNAEYSYVDQERAVLDVLLRQGYAYGKDVVYYEVPAKKDHRESIVAERVAYPFVFFWGRKAQTLQNLDIAVQKVDAPVRITGPIVNPVATFDNGLRYSLYSLATYTLEKGGSARIGDTGIVDLGKERSITVRVRYQGMERFVTVREGPLDNGPRPE